MHSIRQVISYLYLRDVYAISRTSINFHVSFVQDDLKRSWILTRKRSGLPLPFGMSEMFLGTLLYGD